MALSIKNVKVENTAKELARITGRSITTVVQESLDRELARQKQILRYVPLNDRMEKAMAIAREIAAMPNVSNMTDDDVLGYDEIGAPTR